MKIAIIHDVFIEFGGAERVLICLLKKYPHADIYIPLMSKKWLSLLKKYSDGKVYTSKFNLIPFIHSASILLKPLIYIYWETLNLTYYDLVISSSHSFSSKSVITSSNTLHISYIHTPPRYLYTEYNETQIIKKPIFRIILSPLLSWLRQIDYIGAQRPNILIANSKTVQKRIQKYYRRKSYVIYPPVNIPKCLPSVQNRVYYIIISRLAKQKGIELAIKACNELSVPLVIVGIGSEEKNLKSISGKTISFKGFVSDSEIPAILVNAKALIHCSIEEDFGIVPIEAMAYGIPIIAYGSGATLETVKVSTGILFFDYSVESLKKAIIKCSNHNFSSNKLHHYALKFSDNIFLDKFTAIVNKNIYQKTINNSIVMS